MSDVAPIVLALYRIVIALRRFLRFKAKQGAFAAPIGEARRIHSVNNKIFTDFSYSPRSAY